MDAQEKEHKFDFTVKMGTSVLSGSFRATKPLEFVFLKAHNKRKVLEEGC